MPNTVRTLNELLTFFHDNTTKDITPQQLRDFVVTANSWIAGSSIFYGDGAPDNDIGIEGSFYIDSTNTVLYGPKGEFIWPSGVSLIGADSTVPGPPGSDGTDGNTILSGSSNPTGGVGSNGDFYINTTAKTLFGPKSAGSWPSGVSLVGPSGTNGTNGSAGADGKTILNGVINPTGGVGNNGDFYINTATNYIFGPKSAGSWPSGVSLIGPIGNTGNTGAAGVDGKTILSGSVNPTGGVGSNGDFYINTATNYIFGPKSAGSWPSGVSLIGPAGQDGTNGQNGSTGAAGADGKTILSGSTNPTGGVGSNGDFYINTATNYIFGPKSAGSWPSGVSLIGPAGQDGTDGIDGAPGADATFAWRGDWADAEVYVAGDVVRGTNGLYLCILGHTSNEGASDNHPEEDPGYEQYWQKLSGEDGTDGTNGNTLLSGTTNPTGGDGNDGDFYINTSTNYIFGPKASGSWPSGVQLNATSSTMVWNEIPTPAPNGSNPSFALAAVPVSNNLMVFKNGMLQQLGSGKDFTLTTSIITFEAGNIPQAVDVLLVTYEA